MEEFPDALPDTSTMFKKWVWKDDSNMLEQISTGFQPKDKSNFLYTKPKAQGRSLKMLSTGSVMNVNKGKGNSSPVSKNNLVFSPKTSTKQATLSLKRKITLENVKGVALDAIVERGEISEAFHQSLRDNLIDELLTSLLLYFDAFFKKMLMENKPNVISNGQSCAKKKELQSAMKELPHAQKRVSMHYCSLLLGLSGDNYHHLHKGKKRQSQTKQDRYFYENLYTFCCQVIWISFKRTHLEVIHKELWRLFRSDTFSAFSRPEDNTEFRLASDLTSADLTDIKLAPSSLHHGRRPPIQSIINQRSPILVSMLPNSKDSSADLLDRRKALTQHFIEQSDNNEIIEEVLVDNLRVGIIGEAMSGYNPFTLAPFGDEEEEKPESIDGSSPNSRDNKNQGEDVED